MIGGLIVSILMAAVGAILNFAVTVSPYQHGFNLNTVGLILMILGGVGVVLSLLLGFAGEGGYHRHRTVIDDGRGNVVRRDDSFI
jgi:hypothetical protein